MLLHRLAPSCTIEKASIDEVYSESGASVCIQCPPVSASPHHQPASSRSMPPAVDAYCPDPPFCTTVDVTSMVDQEVTQVGCCQGLQSG